MRYNVAQFERNWSAVRVHKIGILFSLALRIWKKSFVQCILSYENLRQIWEILRKNRNFLTSEKYITKIYEK